MSTGKMRIQLIANMNVVFKYLKSTEGIRLQLIGKYILSIPLSLVQHSHT
jgi:hypothetical protein